MNNPSAKNSSKWTIREVVQWTTDYFRQKGIDSARLDAEVLLAHALGADRLYLYLNLDKPLSQQERDKYRELVTRRGRREPVALITGRKEFWSINLRVHPGVLIPRPETEVLVQAVLDEIRELRQPRVLDIGTGSGAAAIAIAHDRPDARVIATDQDPAAVHLAWMNAKEADTAEHMAMLAADLFSCFRPGPHFHVICSNPPYVSDDEMMTLAPEIFRFEPRSALAAGPEGLDVIRAIASQAREFLAAKGALILEMGAGQEKAVREIFETAGLGEEIAVFRDLAGIPRVVKGRS
ncbi:MAG: peptide chain release factor N(5)-glutamine methyltransferase [Thermodesulfobacteriota bacterium]